MTLALKLFQALDIADNISVDGVDTDGSMLERNGTRNYELADETNVTFADQDIVIDEDGDAQVVPCDTDEQGQAYRDLAPVRVCFQVLRPLTLAAIL